ncbi:MAG: putative transposase [Gammaproteobacteria bacterium]|jgi:putative transposase
MDQNKSVRRKRRTAAQWQALFSEQSRSGLSVKAFCTAQGIGYSTFSNWKSRLANVEHPANQAMHFVELSPPENSTDKSWDVELILGPDIVLRIAHR